MTATANATWMWLHIAGDRRLIHRDRLATAILLTLDHPGSPGSVREALVAEHGMSCMEALRMTIAAAHCIAHNIEP